MEFKTDKFYKTRKGQKVRIYHNSPGNYRNLHGAFEEDGKWKVASWNWDGRHGIKPDTVSELDITQEWDSIFNIDESSYKAWSSEMPIGPKPPKDFYGSDYAVDALNYSGVSETWQKKINKVFQDMAVYGTGTIHIPDGSLNLSDCIVQFDAIPSIISFIPSGQQTSQICNCGGTINVHKKDCSENNLSLDELAEQAANAIDLYSGLDHGESYPIGMGYPIPNEALEGLFKKCECGSEKVGSSRHSEWCPKYGAF